MHGIGNDYIYFNCRREQFADPAALAVRLSDRHTSVGGDGIVLLLESGIADVGMRMFNADGSEGSMCGNAVRCVARLMRDMFGCRKRVISVETRAGVKRVEALESGLYRVCMGSPAFAPRDIPALFPGERAVSRPLAVGDAVFPVTCLSMGNPHCVVFVDNTDETDVKALGPLFEENPAFPDRINTEFTEICAENTLKVRVYERGSGETLACGTGACAAAVAAVVNGFCRQGDITVRLRGGELSVGYTGDTVLLTGPAEFAFTGMIDL